MSHEVTKWKESAGRAGPGRPQLVMDSCKLETAREEEEGEQERSHALNAPDGERERERGSVCVCETMKLERARKPGRRRQQERRSDCRGEAHVRPGDSAGRRGM